MVAPAVSIIVPAYNTSDLLPRCIDSLTNQTLTNIEIIIVDDGSTDDTNDVASQLAENDPRIQYIHLDSNVGTFHARLKGFLHARGEYIGTVDSDDWVHETMYSRLYEEAKAHECDIVECRLKSISTTNRDKHLGWSDHFFLQLKGEDILHSVLQRKIWHIAANKIFDRRLFDKSRDFLSSIEGHIVVADDKLLTFPLFFYAKKYKSILSRLYFYFDRDESTSNQRTFTHDRRHIKDTCTVDRYIRSFLADLPADSELVKMLDQNERQELQLILKNISYYEPSSEYRSELYDALISQYGPRFFHLMYDGLRRDKATDEPILSDGDNFFAIMNSMRQTEGYSRLVIRKRYPLIYAIYFPFYSMLRLTAKLMRASSALLKSRKS